MSNVNLYSIFDSKAEQYGTVFAAVSDGLAVRMFLTGIGSGVGDLSRYPEDFFLFTLGNFDDTTGLLDSLPSPRMILSGVSAVQQLRGAAVGGESPLKPQSDPSASSTDEPLENTFVPDGCNNSTSSEA